MKKSTFIALFFCMLLVSCSPRKIAVSSSTTDSVSTETVYVEKIRVDTVEVRLPGAVIERIVRDSMSIIEKDNVRTTARIANGLLYHDLNIEPLNVRAPVNVVDTETIRNDVSARVEIREVPVNLPLTWWEQFWCTSGKVSWGFLAAVVAFLIYKILRR